MKNEDVKITHHQKENTSNYHKMSFFYLGKHEFFGIYIFFKFAGIVFILKGFHIATACFI